MSERFAYICVEPCGCVTAAAVDCPEYAKDNAREIAKWIRQGGTVERVGVEDARARFARKWPCDHVAGAAAPLARDQLTLDTA